jgi:hypothetical protein
MFDVGLYISAGVTFTRSINMEIAFKYENR